MGAPFFRRDERLDPVGEKDQPDLIVVLDRGECEDGAYFRGDFILGLRDGAEVPRPAEVHDKHDRQFPLFLEHLHEGAVETGRRRQI